MEDLDDFLCGHISDEQPSAALLHKAVNLISKKAYRSRENVHLRKSLQNQNRKHPSHLYSSSPRPGLCPPLFAGSSNHLQLPYQLLYQSNKDTITWLNEMEGIVNGGQMGPDGNEDRRAGLRGYRQRRGKGRKAQVESYRKAEKARLRRVQSDEIWKERYDQGRIELGKKAYFSRRQPAMRASPNGLEPRIMESPQLSDDSEEETVALYNAPGRPDFFRRRLQNSSLPVDLLRLWDEIDEWSSSSESEFAENQSRSPSELPGSNQQGIKLHLERKDRRKRLRVERENLPVQGQTEDTISQEDDEPDSLLDHLRDVEVHRSVTHPERALNGKEVVYSSDQGEKELRVYSIEKRSESEKNQNLATTEDHNGAEVNVDLDLRGLEERQEAAWAQEDQDRQRHSSRPPSISQSAASQLKQSSSSIPFSPASRPRRNAATLPSHSSPSPKSHSKSTSRISNALPSQTQQPAKSSSPRHRAHHSRQHVPQQDDASEENATSTRSQNEANRIIAIAQATTTAPTQSRYDTKSSSVTDDPRFQSTNFNTFCMTQPSSKNTGPANGTSPKRASSQVAGEGESRAFSSIKIQREQERGAREGLAAKSLGSKKTDLEPSLFKRTEAEEEAEEEEEEDEEAEEEEEEVDQLNSLQSKSGDQLHSIPIDEHAKVRGNREEGEESGVGESTGGKRTPLRLSRTSTPRRQAPSPYRAFKRISPYQNDTLVTLNSQSPDSRDGGHPHGLVTTASSSKSHSSPTRMTKASRSQLDNQESSLVESPPRTNKSIGASSLSPLNKKSTLSGPSFRFHQGLTSPSRSVPQEGDLVSSKSNTSSARKKSPSTSRSFPSHASLMMASALQGSPSSRARKRNALESDEEHDELDVTGSTSPYAQTTPKEKHSQRTNQTTAEHISSTDHNSLPAKLSKSASSPLTYSSRKGHMESITSFSQSRMNSSPNKSRVNDPEKSFKSTRQILITRCRHTDRNEAGRKGDKTSAYDGNENGRSTHLTGSSGRRAGNFVDGAGGDQDNHRSPSSSIEKARGRKRGIEGEAEGSKSSREVKEDQTPKRRKGDANELHSNYLSNEEEVPSPSAAQVQRQL